MHIVLAFLSTVVTILVLINRLSEAGIDLTWLNSFTWHLEEHGVKSMEVILS